MAAPPLSVTKWKLFIPVVEWVQANVLTAIGVAELGTIGATYLLAWLFSKRIRDSLEKRVKDVTKPGVLLNPRRLSILLGYTVWLLLLWFCETLAKEFGLPDEILPMAINFALAVMVVHFASLFIKSAFWSRFAFVVCLIVISLRVFKLWEPAVRLLNSMAIDLGSISFTVWGLLRATFISAILWFAALTVSRFFGNWLTRSKHLTSSDRILVERAFNAALIGVVVLISLSAAGIHFAAVAITGGAFGIAIGMGLQKIGSNVVSGLNLLISKPIRPGDVIAMTDTISGIDYGEITQMSLTYVRVATRDGTEQLIPNELFLVSKVENLSYSNNLYRLRIPVGISYAANVERASSLAVTAAMNVGRVLRSPGPQCLISGFGDSSVALELRVWINDPKNGIGSVRSAVLSAVGDAFHASGIEFPYPQRDLHIKDAVPLQINLAEKTLTNSAENG